MGTQNSILATYSSNYNNETLENNENLNNNQEFKLQNELLKFHEISGSNVYFDSYHKKARRIEGFCNAIVLTNRSIKINEIIYVKFIEKNDNWRGYVRFGFTCHDPYLNCNDIKKARYICPDLTNKPGYWAKGLTDDIKENDILYFYVNKDGYVFYGINNIFKGLFFEDTTINVYFKLWAIFDIYGNTTAIELIDESKATGILPVMIHEGNNIDAISPLASSLASSTISDDSLTLPNRNRQIENIFQVDTLLNGFRGLHDNDLNESIVLNSLAKPINNNNQNKIFQNSDVDLSLPLYKLLHHSNDKENNLKFNKKLFGKNIKFNNNNQIAYRASQTLNAYVFIDNEIEINRSICLQIINIDTKNLYSGNSNNEISLEFGCTNCCLDKLKQSDLPNDSYDLLNRQEYWIINKNILNNASIGDELCLVVDNSGNILYKVNGKQRTKCLFNVDITQKLYFFFNICGKTTAIRLVPSCKLLENKLNEKLAINKLNSIQISKTTIHDLNKLNLNKKPIEKEECRVCLDGIIESVIYACGHMCMCWNCAIKIQNDKSNNKKPLCPICRLEIKDVIRVYKS